MHHWHHHDNADGPNLWTLIFWRQTVERMVKTAGGTAATTFGASAVPVFGIDLDVTTSLKLVAGTAIMSVLFSLGSIAVGPKGTPSAVPVAPPRRARRRRHY